MNKKDKELLLIDLSARINYKVKCKSDIFKKKNLVGMDGDGLIFWSRDENNKACYDVLEPSKWNVKPYLRPMSSMTEEETKEYAEIWANREPYMPGGTVDFFNAHHLDYRGLIPIGLALEATENMYQI